MYTAEITVNHSRSPVQMKINIDHQDRDNLRSILLRLYFRRLRIFFLDAGREILKQRLFAETNFEFSILPSDILPGKTKTAHHHAVLFKVSTIQDPAVYKEAKLSSRCFGEAILLFRAHAPYNQFLGLFYGMIYILEMQCIDH